MTRLFVAAWPPAPFAGDLAAWTEEAVSDAADVRAVPADHLHVTLRFLGDADADEVAARLATADLRAAEVHLGPTVIRLGGRQLVAPVSGADRMATAVRVATAGLGEPDRRDYVGHLTLARVRRGATSSLEGRTVTGSFRLDDIRLVASRLEPTGSVYTSLRTFAVV